MSIYYILVFIVLQRVTFYHIVAEFSHFQIHEGFNGIYCSDHAEVYGTGVSIVLCGWRCMIATECRGFFQNNITQTCTLVTSVSVPDSGCQAVTGSHYYMMLVDGVFDCYNFSSDDMTRVGNLESVSSVCTSYKYHMFHSDVGTSAQYGCDGCECCKTRGCYSGTTQLYSGTWSRSVSGRVCQKWGEQYPHNQTRYLGVYPPGENYTTAENYCRDPDYEGYLWCYTMDPDLRYETCGIPGC